MSDRMVDIQPTEKYEEIQNTAANEYVKGEMYDGSVEAVALKQAFVLGANTSLQYENRQVAIIRAVLAGRKWGRLPQNTHRRLVVTGKFIGHTLSEKVDTASTERVVAAGLPIWTDRANPTVSETDQDLLDKQQAESSEGII